MLGFLWKFKFIDFWKSVLQLLCCYYYNWKWSQTNIIVYRKRPSSHCRFYIGRGVWRSIWSICFLLCFLRIGLKKNEPWCSLKSLWLAGECFILKYQSGRGQIWEHCTLLWFLLVIKFETCVSFFLCFTIMYYFLGWNKIQNVYGCNWSKFGTVQGQLILLQRAVQDQITQQFRLTQHVILL